MERLAAAMDKMSELEGRLKGVGLATGWRARIESYAKEEYYQPNEESSNTLSRASYSSSLAQIGGMLKDVSFYSIHINRYGLGSGLGRVNRNVIPTSVNIDGISNCVLYIITFKDETDVSDVSIMPKPNNMILDANNKQIVFYEPSFPIGTNKEWLLSLT